MTTTKLSGLAAFEGVLRGEWRTLVRELGWRRAIGFKWEASRLNWIVTERPHPLCWFGRHKVEAWQQTEYEDVYSYELRGRQCARGCRWSRCDFDGLNGYQR